MNASLTPSSAQSDLSGLIRAIELATGEDAVPANIFTPQQWQLFAAYMQPRLLSAGQTLFARDAVDRSLYFIESGSLSVHYEDEKQRLRMLTVHPGSMVGELAFFMHGTRRATVQAGAACKLWCLGPLRFTELSNRQPALALQLTMAAGAVLGKRLYHRSRRVAAA